MSFNKNLFVFSGGTFFSFFFFEIRFFSSNLGFYQKLINFCYVFDSIENYGILLEPLIQLIAIDLLELIKYHRVFLKICEIY